MIIDFTIEDLILNSYLQKNFHTLRGVVPFTTPAKTNLGQIFT